MASANNNFKSSDEYRRQKELEEARKAGIAPAEVDEEGNEINPHIPQYMSSAPWYLNNNKPSLKHQKNWKEQLLDSRRWYDRGTKVFQAKKWRKGACENCGAISHATKDCLERPRMRGARWTDKHIAPDEKIEQIELQTWDSKRDRWNGYDAGDFAKVVERYERVEAARKDMKKKQEVERRYRQSELGDKDKDEDEDKIEDAEDTGFGEVKKRVRTTAGGASGSVRNLRIREDTAKYLLNLDLDSSHYDPKSRSMREDPLPGQGDKSFAGDNFVRHTGDYKGWQALNLHAIQAQQRGLDVNMQAVPSQVELLYRQFKAKKEKLQQQTKEEVLDKYGQLAEKNPDDVFLLGQSEQYVEFDRFGRVVKGQITKARSRYEEDVYINNHTSVWGSWWKDGKWGYACCHQTVKNSYCTGSKGQKAAINAEESAMGDATAIDSTVPDPESSRPEQDHKDDKETSLNGYNPNDQDLWGGLDEGIDLDQEKVKRALKVQEERERALQHDERKRGYNSLSGGNDQITPEEMEAYRMKKTKREDPLAAIEKGKSQGKEGGSDGYMFV